MILVEINPIDIVFDDVRYPDRDTSFIYSHLHYYCSKFSPLPAISVTLEKGRVIIVSGHKYLRIALDLEHPSIRAVLKTRSKAMENELFKLNSVQKLNWEEHRADEKLKSIDYAWHIFFFSSSLIQKQKDAFEEIVLGVFDSVKRSENNRNITKISFIDEFKLVEFYARTPFHDQNFALTLLQASISFSKNHNPILSYQGRKFEF